MRPPTPSQVCGKKKEIASVARDFQLMIQMYCFIAFDVCQKESEPQLTTHHPGRSLQPRKHLTVSLDVNYKGFRLKND